MTAADVKAKIYAEIGDQWNTPHAHGIDLKVCLVEPELRKYRGVREREIPEKLWFVLQEVRNGVKGYAMIYSESMDQYGLAVTDKKDGPIVIGFYGSFMETLEAM